MSFISHSFIAMRWAILFSWLGCASLAVADGTVWATPHDSYSSSVGVLGCKINTDRVAYWPSSVDCDKICVSLSYGGRTVYLLKIDQSGGAHDVSYDAWNYLNTGYSALSKPTAGGGVSMEYKDVEASKCADLIHTDGHKLPFSAANSMNFLASCLDKKDSWVAKNYLVYNILDPICSWGLDEKCTLNYPTDNQPKCPSTLGTPAVLTTAPVYNIQYPSGNKVLASSGRVVAVAGSSGSVLSPGGSGGNIMRLGIGGWMMLTSMLMCLLLHSL
jgi:hypothetical protein